jgi:tryptophanyl-tRNA synthetase
MKKRILTGDTPTGKLHLGHYVGTLENRVKLQNEYEMFVLFADTHALTTLSSTPKVISEYTRQVLLDNLAVGLNPENVTFLLNRRFRRYMNWLQFLACMFPIGEL